MEKTITSKSPTETSQLASEIANTLQPGNVLALTGDLGAGKTTFTQHLAQHLGITNQVQSPTFTLIREYPLPNKPETLYHIDLYRIKAKHELDNLGISELINQNKNIIVIEWPELILSQLPSHTVKLTFAVNPDNSRTIQISTTS